MERVKAPWDGVALVCRKCGKKLGGGFGKDGKHGLAKVLRATLKLAGRRRALRIMKVDCLGLCPRNGVSVIGPATPGHILVVHKGAEPDAVLATLIRPG